MASIIPGWKFPTHHDCSITWWKAYYYYELSVSSAKQDRNNVYKSFHLLKQKERKGVKMYLTKLIHIPMYGIVLPLNFIEDLANPVSFN